MVHQNYYFVVARVHFESMGLINKVDMVCLSPVGYGVILRVPIERGRTMSTTCP